MDAFGGQGLGVREALRVALQVSESRPFLYHSAHGAMTYGQVGAQAEALACFLGQSAGDVTIMAANRWEWVAADFACALARKVSTILPVPTLPKPLGREVKSLAQLLGREGVVVTDLGGLGALVHALKRVGRKGYADPCVVVLIHSPTVDADATATLAEAEDLGLKVTPWAEAASDAYRAAPPAAADGALPVFTRLSDPFSSAFASAEVDISERDWMRVACRSGPLTAVADTQRRVCVCGALPLHGKAPSSASPAAVASLSRECAWWAAFSGASLAFLGGDPIAALSACSDLRPTVVVGDVAFWQAVSDRCFSVMRSLVDDSLGRRLLGAASAASPAAPAAPPAPPGPPAAALDAVPAQRLFQLRRAFVATPAGTVVSSQAAEATRAALGGQLVVGLALPSPAAPLGIAALPPRTAALLRRACEVLPDDAHRALGVRGFQPLRHAGWSRAKYFSGATAEWRAARTPLLAEERLDGFAFLHSLFPQRQAREPDPEVAPPPAAEGDAARLRHLRECARGLLHTLLEEAALFWDADHRLAAVGSPPPATPPRGDAPPPPPPPPKASPPPPEHLLSHLEAMQLPRPARRSLSSSAAASLGRALLLAADRPHAKASPPRGGGGGGDAASELSSGGSAEEGGGGGRARGRSLHARRSRSPSPVGHERRFSGSGRQARSVMGRGRSGARAELLSPRASFAGEVPAARDGSEWVRSFTFRQCSVLEHERGSTCELHAAESDVLDAELQALRQAMAMLRRRGAAWHDAREAGWATAQRSREAEALAGAKDLLESRCRALTAACLEPCGPALRRCGMDRLGRTFDDFVGRLEPQGGKASAEQRATPPRRNSLVSLIEDRAGGASPAPAALRQLAAAAYHVRVARRGRDAALGWARRVREDEAAAWGAFLAAQRRFADAGDALDVDVRGLPLCEAPPLQWIVADGAAERAAPSERDRALMRYVRACCAAGNAYAEDAAESGDVDALLGVIEAALLGPEPAWMPLRHDDRAEELLGSRQRSFIAETVAELQASAVAILSGGFARANAVADENYEQGRRFAVTAAAAAIVGSAYVMARAGGRRGGVPLSLQGAIGGLGAVGGDGVGVIARKAPAMVVKFVELLTTRVAGGSA